MSAGETPSLKTTPLPDDPALQFLRALLKSIRGLQESQEALHRRIDAIAQHIPGASRDVSGPR